MRFAVWYLFGVLAMGVATFWKAKQITVSEVVTVLIVGIAGPLTLIVIGYGYGDVVLWRRGKGK